MFTRSAKAILYVGSRMFSNGSWTVNQPCYVSNPKTTQEASSTSQQRQPQGHVPGQASKVPILFYWTIVMVPFIVETNSLYSSTHLFQLYQLAPCRTTYPAFVISPNKFKSTSGYPLEYVPLQVKRMYVRSP